LEHKADVELLKRLTRTVDKPVEQSDRTLKTEPVETPGVSEEQIKRNILDELTGRAEKTDGSTEPTDRTQSGESEDA